MCRGAPRQARRVLYVCGARLGCMQTVHVRIEPGGGFKAEQSVHGLGRPHAWHRAPGVGEPLVFGGGQRSAQLPLIGRCSYAALTHP